MAKVDTDTVIKQTNSIVLKHSNNKVCKNRIEMPFKELIKHISQKLMGYAMTLSKNHPDDALDLIQSTMVKLIKNQDKLMDSDQPMAYAKKILENTYIDNYRKKQKMPLVSIEANNIPILGEIVAPGTLEGGDVAWLDEKTLSVTFMLALYWDLAS
mgnify:CR=1 FL=1